MLFRSALPLASSWGDARAEAEERRLLFVGLTRARDTVELGWHVRPAQPQVMGAVSPVVWGLPARWVRFEDGARSPTPPPSVPLQSPAPPPAQTQTTPAWAIGGRVRHPRYGEGVVSACDAETIACVFGKFGERSFPLLMCPLVPAST